MTRIDNTDFKNLIEKYPVLWTKKKIEKGAMLYEVDKPLKQIYYCESGIVRTYVYDKQKSKEITNGFFSDNEPIVPVLTLTEKRSVLVNFQVIEDSWMYIIKIADWKIIEEQEPNIKDILFEILANTFVHLHQYQLNSNYNTKTRYILLLEKYPYLNRVTDVYVASYLGVSEKTLERIKSSPFELSK